MDYPAGVTFSWHLQSLAEMMDGRAVTASFIIMPASELCNLRRDGTPQRLIETVLRLLLIIISFMHFVTVAAAIGPSNK